MKPRVVVIDTNVVVSGLLTRDPDAPTARILDGMRGGRFPFLLSADLLAEYRRVLLRPKIRARHRLPVDSVDAILEEISAAGAIRVPESAESSTPDAGDAHLWALVDCESGCALVTGDQPLHENPPDSAHVLSPAAFCELVAL